MIMIIINTFFYVYIDTWPLVTLSGASASASVGIATVANIVGEVSKAIWDCLVEDFMPVPTKQDWSAIAEGFFQRWNFPNCLGSIDGKHVVIQAPPNSGSLFRNYKHAFSIVLLAVVDADYLFRMVDVGGYGRNSDGGTLNNSPFGEALKDGTLDLPDDCTISGAEHRGLLPHVFVGDEAFPLRAPAASFPWITPHQGQKGV
ncbi:hypothetical protein ACEWY4_013913 [Coilia grayii]|uniref:DDE Tnp4 domain-containing protein n=1 Tax=Coilia grayii TaxID=363190 RepID=A0ABD1JXU3_9TELE